MAGIDPSRQFIPLKIAVLTISDTRSAADDKSGATLIERIEKAGHILADRAIVTDDVKKIRAQVKKWINGATVDVVITTGGTGFTGRDVTPEAVEPLFEKRMDGRARAATLGMRFSCTSSIIAIGRAISSRSCRGSMSTCAGRRRKARRFRHDPKLGLSPHSFRSHVSLISFLPKRSCRSVAASLKPCA